jgi:hypothetical protein
MLEWNGFTCFTLHDLDLSMHKMHAWPCYNEGSPIATFTSYPHAHSSIFRPQTSQLLTLYLVTGKQISKQLQKYMHEFHSDRDHAMCNIQNRSIPAVQLTQLRKLSNKNFQGTGVLKSSQSCQVLQCKVAARQWRCLAEIVTFSGSCSRCLVLSPLPCPTLPK